MTETLEFLARHGYGVLFVWILAEQVGIPIPAVPVLLAAGALTAASGAAPPFVLKVARGGCASSRVPRGDGVR